MKKFITIHNENTYIFIVINGRISTIKYNGILECQNKKKLH